MECSGVASRFLTVVSRGEFLQLHLAINGSGLVEPIEPGSVWEKVLAISYLYFPLRIACYRVSPLN